MQIHIQGSIDNTSPQHSLSIALDYRCGLDNSEKDAVYGFFGVSGKAYINGGPEGKAEDEFLAFITGAEATLHFRRMAEKDLSAICRLRISEDRKYKEIHVDIDLTSKSFDNLAILVASGAKSLELTFNLDNQQISYALARVQEASLRPGWQWEGGLNEFRLGVQYFKTEEWLMR